MEWCHFLNLFIEQPSYISIAGVCSLRDCWPKH